MDDLFKDCGVLNLSRLTPNDILVIRGDISGKKVQTLITMLKPKLPKNIMIWLAKEGETLEVITEDEMNHLGWYRKK